MKGIALRFVSRRFHPLILGGLVSVASGLAAEPDWLWQIGKPDNDNREFALAPGRYGEFRDDGFFVVGQSDPQRDWPYVQPGPVDGWAGGRPHTFSVVFGLREAPAAGSAQLALDLLDTHRGSPPVLRIDLNGQTFTRELPSGAGDASIFGEPARGREHRLTLDFPAHLLKAGANEVAITTQSGSWLLYDWLGLTAPRGLELTPVTGTLVGSVQSPPVLVERDGRLLQTIELAVRHLGEPALARVRVGDGDATELALRGGVQRLEVTMPAVEREQTVRVQVEVPDEPTVTRTLTLKPVRRWVVYLLPHSHVDIGYTHVQTDVERAQWKYLEMAIETARRTAAYPAGSRFKWNVEVLWAVDSYLQQATADQRRLFLEAVRDGQVGLDALYGNMLTGLCRSEEWLRLLRAAPELARRTGVPVESAMITDVPGYTWGVVTAFAHTGVKYFSIGPNGGDRIGHTIAAWGDRPFWWIGPNGRDRLLVWMTGTGYYRVFSSADNLLDYLGRLEAKGYPYDFVQVRHCLGDNGAPDVNFADTVRQWNATHAYPKLVIATTAEMFRDFERRYGDQLPTARGDFTPYWEDGAASSARETALNRASADRLVQAETLFAMFSPGAYPLGDFYRAWRNVVLYDEHTWGAHNSISEPDHPFVKSQWAIKQAFALDADRQSRDLIEAALASRGQPVSPPSDRVNVVDVIGTTHGAPYALVVVPKELSTAGDTVKTAPDSATSLPAQRLATGELIFRPCWGQFATRRYYIGNEPTAPVSFPGAKAEGNTLAAGRSGVAGELSLRLDEQTGAIASLIYDGRELVASNAPTALNDYFYLPGRDVAGVQRNGPVRLTIRERGPLVASIVVESDAPGCRTLTREIRLHALRNYVEIVNTLDKQAVRAKEGVHFGFGFHVPEGVVRMDVPWGVVRPETDQIPGACRNWFTVQRWVDISSASHGVTWFTPDAPLVQFGGLTANLIGSMSLGDWITNLPPSQTVYSWAMNNHWHTNYRAEQEGPTVFRFYVWPHGEPYHQTRIARLAAELAQPLIAAPARGECPEQPRLTVSNPDLLVSAFKPSDDRRAFIVRLFGTSDQPVRTHLNWADPAPASVWLSDNSEQPLAPVTGEIEVPPLSVVTLRAELPR